MVPQTSMMEPFYENSQRLLILKYFRKKKNFTVDSLLNPKYASDIRLKAASVLFYSTIDVLKSYFETYGEVTGKTL